MLESLGLINILVIVHVFANNPGAVKFKRLAGIYAVDWTLSGHVISSQLVISAATCGKLCAIEDRCVSYNVETLVGPRGAQPSLLCELNSDVGYSAPELVNRPGFSHYTIVS